MIQSTPPSSTMPVTRSSASKAARLHPYRSDGRDKRYDGQYFNIEDGEDEDGEDEKSLSAGSLSPPPQQYTWYDCTKQQSFPAPPLSTFIQLERTNAILKAGAEEAGAEDIERALYEALTNLGAVALFYPQKKKFMASVRSCNGFVRFRASVFNNKGVHHIEFQRSSGYSVDFCSVWRAFLADSNIKELLQTQPQEPARAPGQPMQVELELETRELAPLNNMLNSEYVDVQCEGLRTLGSISKTLKNAMMFQYRHISK